jgi:hypothetical protein
MTPAFIAISILGLLATVLFVAGYFRGASSALTDRQQSHSQTTIEGENKARYVVPVVFAVATSAVVIALVGVDPIFVYLGPLLAIATSAMIGIAFFYDRES